MKSAVIKDLRPGDPASVGPYRLLGRLGSGGMGMVYLARSLGGRLVAIKVIKSELAEERGFRARFAREVAAARGVSGMFTAAVVDADTDADMPWLATAYVPGPSLTDAVDEQGPLPEATVLALAAGLAEGLQAIHRAGLVHRDLKPSNVLLADDGPRVIDFGISRAREASMLTQTGMVVGSPGFLSPEQAEGHVVDLPSDVFSLGAVLTFAATGDGPFGSGPTPALLYRVVNKPPDLSRVPAGLRPLLEWCMAKNPADRPTTDQLLAELATDDGAVTPEWLTEPIAETIARYVRTVPATPTPTPPAEAPAEDAGPARDARAGAAVADEAATGEPLADAPAAGEPRSGESTGTGPVTGESLAGQAEEDLPADGLPAEGLAAAGAAAASAAAAPAPLAAAAESVSALTSVPETAGTISVAPQAPATDTRAPATATGEALAPIALSGDAPQDAQTQDIPVPGIAPVMPPVPAAAAPGQGEPPAPAEPAAPGARGAGAPGTGEPVVPLRRLPRRRWPLVPAAAVVVIVAVVATILSLAPGGSGKPTAGPSSSLFTVSHSPSPSRTPTHRPTATPARKPTPHPTHTVRKHRTPTVKPSASPSPAPATAPTTPVQTYQAPTATPPPHTTPASASPTTPAQSGPQTISGYSGASGIGCDQYGSVGSSSGGSAASFSFANQSPADMQVWYLTSGGSGVLEGTVAPGSSFGPSVNTRQDWMVANSGGGCIGILGITGSGQVTVS